jgi:hypothetical protein
VLDNERRMNSVRLALRGDLGAVGLCGVREVAVLDDHRRSASSIVGCGGKVNGTYVIPSACTSSVCTLKALETVDEHTVVQVLVDRAHAARGRARHVVRAVGLLGVLQLARVVGP